MAAITLLLLVGCDAGDDTPLPDATPTTAGARLEAAAVAQGIVADPAASDPVGAWARESDRVCIVPGKDEDRRRIGISSDYGDGQGCSGAGTIQRNGSQLRVAIGACRFVATLAGDWIVFPGEMPAACDGLCRGRASLAGIQVERESAAASEAATLRGRGGQRLCG